MDRRNTTFNLGAIEGIVGTMFSGKSRELLFRGMRAEDYGSVPVYYFKPAVDTRDDNNISSRDGLKKEAIVFKSGKEILEHVHDKPSLILIDEAQFADESLIYAIQLLKNMGHNVVLSGLPLDFRGQPFNIMPQIMALCDYPLKTVYSVCSIEGCHNDGASPQRLRNGEPDSALSPTVIIEGSAENISYEPRCFDHHSVKDIEQYLTERMNNNQ